MRVYDIIQKKKDGRKLSVEEIKYFVEGYTAGIIPDYQAAALCMAIYFQGMDDEETAALTFAIRDSGEKLDFSDINGIRVDKHSTGGVGDKTSLIVAPIVASLGVKIAKMSGRGLGHTGGTVDKLESIRGFKTDIAADEFVKIVNDVGLAIVGQNKELAPADKKLYALRDVTATVDSIPLIASSIMGKKLAADDDCIVLDVKIGSGSFMKTKADGEKLARAMVDIGKRAGKKTLALLTDMDVPLGNAIGNALEVKEAVATLKGEGPKDLTELCLALSAEMLALADKGNVCECRKLAENAMADGSALKTFKSMVAAQGGDVAYIDDTSKFPSAKYTESIRSPKSGYIAKINAETYGIASLTLGAGRSKLDDEIDYSAGIILKKKVGDEVTEGEEIAVLYTSNEESLSDARSRIISATEILTHKPSLNPIILGRVE